MIKTSCPYCEAVRDVECIVKEENMQFKGRAVVFGAEYCRCSSCGNDFESAEQMDKNLLAIRESYIRQYGSVTPEKMKSIREKYNASQKAFSLILGMGELTINSYEQEKSTPTSTNNLLLQLSDNPLIFFEMYKINKEKIGLTQRERIENSDAYKNCSRWGGLENLYQGLSASDREAVENKTVSESSSVTNIVVNMVKAQIPKTNFEIYQDAQEVTSDTIAWRSGMYPGGDKGIA